MPIFYPIPIYCTEEKVPIGVSIILVAMFIALIAFIIWAIIEERK